MTLFKMNTTLEMFDIVSVSFEACWQANGSARDCRFDRTNMDRVPEDGVKARVRRNADLEARALQSWN